MISQSKDCIQEKNENLNSSALFNKGKDKKAEERKKKKKKKKKKRQHQTFWNLTVLVNW